MGDSEELSMVVDYYDKSQNLEDSILPKFQIKLGHGITYAHKREEIVNFASIALSARSNSQLYKFERIKLENKLNEDEFFAINNTIRNMVSMYNNIGKHIAIPVE